LYHYGIDVVLQDCLTHEEAKQFLNDCHLGACGGHIYGMDTAQKNLRVGYIYPSIFKYCIEVVKQFPPCHMFQRKACTHPSPLHPIVFINPFSKWGIDFMQCKLTSARGHNYIIILVNYFTKWDEAMPTFFNDGRTTTIFCVQSHHHSI
jgi:hypothetical protein